MIATYALEGGQKWIAAAGTLLTYVLRGFSNLNFEDVLSIPTRIPSTKPVKRCGKDISLITMIY
jgi:hypothetical protein